MIVRLGHGEAAAPNAGRWQPTLEGGRSGSYIDWDFRWQNAYSASVSAILSIPLHRKILGARGAAGVDGAGEFDLLQGGQQLRDLS